MSKRLKFGMYGDNCHVADRALHLCRGSEDIAKALVEWLYLDTRDRLTSAQVWPAVESLADGLVEGKTLGTRAARSLFRAIYQHQ